MTTDVAPPESTTGTWQAHLDIALIKRGDQTRLRTCRHRGPLYLQKPFYPEGSDLAHLYVLHPPGGVVSGDHLSIHVHCDSGSRGLVTTPGAARMYRAREPGSMQRQDVTLKVAAGASLEWFPLETIVHDGARVSLNTAIDLAEGAQLAAWELTCFGLHAAKSPFQNGSFDQIYRISVAGRRALHERLFVDDGNRACLLKGPVGLRGHTVCGLFVMGPFPDPIDDSLMASLRDTTNTKEADLSWLEGFMVGRYLGDSAESGRSIFCQWWSQLRPLLLARPASPPRIWLT